MGWAEVGVPCRDLNMLAQPLLCRIQGRMGTPEQVWFLGDSDESLGAVTPHSPPQPSVHGGTQSLCGGHRGDSGRDLSPRRRRKPCLLPSSGHGPARGQQEGMAGRSPRGVNEGASLPHPQAPHSLFPPRPSPCNLHKTVLGSCSVLSG